jgi:hypothetical protein
VSSLRTHLITLEKNVQVGLNRKLPQRRGSFSRPNIESDMLSARTVDLAGLDESKQKCQNEGGGSMCIQF